MAVKISAQLTGAQRDMNGLNRIEEQLVEQPRGDRYAVIRYDVKRVADEISEGIKIPTVEIVHIEPVEGVTADRVREILAQEYEDRTGKSLDGDPTLAPENFFNPDAVPEASGEEILAERAERLAAEAEEERAERGPVAVPAFSGGGDAA